MRPAREGEGDRIVYHVNRTGRAPTKWLLIVLLSTALFFLPVPAGVTPQAWRLLAIFVGTVVGLILQPLPLGAMALVGIVAAALTGALPAG